MKKIVAPLALFLLGLFLWLFTTENEEDKIAALITKAATLAVLGECDPFLEILDLSAPGFSFTFMGQEQIWNDTPDGLNSFSSQCENLAPRIKGTSFDISNMEIEIEGNSAKAIVLTSWNSGRKGHITVSGKLWQGFQMAFSKRNDIWRFRKVMVLDQGETVKLVMRNLGSVSTDK